jgi:hypothetical protein
MGIGEYAFLGCPGLTSVKIPNSVMSIGIDAISDCDSLTSVVIPNGVTRIGKNAFSSCSILTSVVIGSGVSVIESHAFRDSKLRTIVSLKIEPCQLMYNRYMIDGYCYVFDYNTFDEAFNAAKKKEFINSSTVQVYNDVLNKIQEIYDGTPEEQDKFTNTYNKINNKNWKFNKIYNKVNNVLIKIFDKIDKRILDIFKEYFDLQMKSKNI